MTNNYIISLGSNQGDSLRILQQAAKALEKNKQLKILQKSSIYKTLPWGKTDQPVFLNAAMVISWSGEPEELMQFLLETEASFGRKREIHWGPRTLDLDMIYGWSVERQSTLLRLPHPYFWERPFVLVPMEDMVPDFSFQGTAIHQRLLELKGYDEVERTTFSWEGDVSWQKQSE